jgi:tetratricopeptide (TPR) repeat protein
MIEAPVRRTLVPVGLRVAGWSLVLVLSSTLLPVVGLAQDEVPTATPEESASAARDAEGRGLFEAGRAAFTDGRYEDALDYFQRAYALSHRSALLYNIGSANDRLRRDAEALVAFEQYVRELPEAANVREVEARIRVLRESLHTDSADHPDGPSQVELDQAAFDAHTREQEGATAPGPADQGPGVVGEWWFWTIIVAVVAGAVVTGVVLGTQDSTVRYPPYTMGDNGIAMTLTLPLP